MSYTLGMTLNGHATLMTFAFHHARNPSNRETYHLNSQMSLFVSQQDLQVCEILRDLHLRTRDLWREDEGGTDTWHLLMIQMPGLCSHCDVSVIGGRTLYSSRPTTNSIRPHIHCAKKPVTTMLTYPWKCTVLHCNHLGNDSTRAIIKVSGHQHQWFPGVSQVVTM